MTALPINLPNGFLPIVKMGDKLIVGEVLATITTQDEEIINLPKALSIKKSLVKKCLKKSPGEGVKIGDVIAEKKSFFGSNIIIKSTVEGTIARYERDTGNLVIKKSSITTSKSLISPVDGVVALCNNKEIVINTDKNVLTGSMGSGDSGQGEVFVLKEDDPYHLDSGAIGKIVVTENLSREMLLKGIGIGVMGLIGCDIKDEDIEYLTDKKLKTPVIKIDKQDFEKISGWNGKKVFLNPELKSIIFLSL